MEKRKDYEIAADEFAALAKSLGLDVTAEFVPFSQSRNAKEKHRSLNWRCTVTRSAKPIAGLEAVDYSAGIAHCPAYKADARALGNANSMLRAKFIEWECENGKRSHVNEYQQPHGTKPILPKTDDVLSSLARNSDVLEYPRFEDWAGDLGYDPDSREAERVYRLCLAQALALRAAIGDDNLAKLRGFAQEM